MVSLNSCLSEDIVCPNPKFLQLGTCEEGGRNHEGQTIGNATLMMGVYRECGRVRRRRSRNGKSMNVEEIGISETDVEMKCRGYTRKRL